LRGVGDSKKSKSISVKAEKKSRGGKKRNVTSYARIGEAAGKPEAKRKKIKGRGKSLQIGLGGQNPVS